LKKEILELAADFDIEEDFEVQCKFLRLLVTSKVTTFIFPLGLARRGNQEAATALWKTLFAEQPDLLSLVTESPDVDVCGKWNVSGLVKTSVRSFPNLDTLIVQGLDLVDVHFRLIGQNLPNLR
jgi:hypothetical protein